MQVVLCRSSAHKLSTASKHALLTSDLILFSCHCLVRALLTSDLILFAITVLYIFFNR